jgi:hypothetical protein
MSSLVLLETPGTLEEPKTKLIAQALDAVAGTQQRVGRC